MNIKTKAIIAMSLILTAGVAVVGYGVVGSIKIHNESARVEDSSYPMMVAAIRLAELVRETNTTVFSAICEEDEEVLTVLNDYELEFGKIVTELLDMENDPNLREIYDKFKRYKSRGSSVVGAYILGGAVDDISKEGAEIALLANELDTSITRYKDTKYQRFSDSLGGIRKQAIGFESVFSVVGIALLILLSIVLIELVRLIARIKQVVEDAKTLASGDISTPIVNAHQDELGVLRNTFEIMRVSLKDLIDNLDNKVKIRTAELQLSKNEISGILNSIDQGIFTFNEDLSVNASHSLKAQEIFEETDFNNTSLPKLLKMDDGAFLKFEEWAKMVLALPLSGKQWGKYAKLSPVREIVEELDGEEHILKIDYRLINSSDKTIMVLGSDISEQVHAERELKAAEYENKALVSRVLAITGCDADELETFLNSTEKSLESISGLDANQLGRDRNEIFRFVHTIKGHSGTLGFDNLAEKLVKPENILSNLDSGEDLDLREWNQTLRAAILELEKILNMKHQLYGANSEAVISIEAKLYYELLSDAKAADKVGPSGSLLESIYYLHSRSLKNYAKKYQKMIVDYGDDNGKAIADLQLENADIRIHQSVLEKVDDAIVHLVRNAIDHGIEIQSVRDRLKKGAGQVSIAYQRKDGLHLFTIADDGKGMDANSIASSALAKELIKESELEGLTENEKLELIFMPGFSTRNTVTDLSGRGVGMNVVKTIIQDLGGDVEVTSEIHKGSKFKLIFPIADDEPGGMH